LNPFGLDNSWLPLPLAIGLALVAFILMAGLTSLSLVLWFALRKTWRKILLGRGRLTAAIGLALILGFALVGPVSMALLYLGTSAIIKGPASVALLGGLVTVCLVYELYKLLSLLLRSGHEVARDPDAGRRRS
jgi:hypothetical protein